MNQPKNGRLVGGIILAAIGVTGLGGMGTADDGLSGAYIIVCLLFIAGGLVLILTYVKSRKRFNAAIQEENARLQREQELRDARKALEKEKIDAELQKLRASKDQIRVCPHCGGSTKGEICEYCGSRL